VPGDDTAGASPVTPLTPAMPAPRTIPARASKRESRRGSGTTTPGLSGLSDDDLEKWLAAEGQQAFRARQILDALWRQNASNADELKPLPNAIRARIAEDFQIDTIVEDEVKVADRGLTEKTLHMLSDGALIESVLMHYPARGFGGPGRPMHRERHTLCISSQAGCAVGCPFCATGELGFGRDLETSEIVDQVRHSARRLAKTGSRITNLVFMGMGEPLLNLDRVLEAITILSDPRRFALGARHIVVSTSGVVPGIRRLTAMGPQFTLAISLHAARDPLRDVLVPLNRRWPVAEVVAAARDHARVTGRRVSYEYVMISGVNDTDVDADALAKLLRGDLAHVNLIPMNPVAHTPWQASSSERVPSSPPESATAASASRSGPIAARTRARHAASWPPTRQARSPHPPLPAGAKPSSARARPRSAAIAARTASPPISRSRSSPEADADGRRSRRNSPLPGEREHPGL
jgi:23S rRNA (adenine2503-C2)-methyltransferase